MTNVDKCHGCWKLVNTDTEKFVVIAKHLYCSRCFDEIQIFGSKWKSKEMKDVEETLG